MTLPRAIHDLLLRCPIKSSGLRLSSILSTAATRSGRFIRHRRRSHRSPPSLPIPPCPHCTVILPRKRSVVNGNPPKRGGAGGSGDKNFVESTGVFIQLFLTIRGAASKIDSVWCTLRKNVPAFHDNLAFAGVGYCASWRFLCLNIFTDPIRCIYLPIEQHGAHCAHLFADALFYKGGVLGRLWDL